MAANYPNSFYDQRTVANKPGKTFDAAKTTVIFAEDLNRAKDEILAIENAVGLNPGKLSWSCITIIIDGAGAAITTGVKAYLTIPFKCTIAEVTMLADVSGSAIIDIWKDTYANHPSTVS